ncbi:hypothetical protein [Kluyvera intermedia]|uniref:Uncharacterized protein n=1 Tax=Kluyvera intermedia TaxID=61648 RepID=A0AA95JYY8_KLUIN|nr:hypothetical protein [Kluyvera intermedia]WGL54471.1 hypothetical protein QBD33_12280 [Kluyvera intermedia]
MSDKYENPKNYPVDAAYQVVLEMVKAGAFNSVSDRGGAFVGTFDKIKERFEELQKEGTSQQ